MLSDSLFVFGDQSLDLLPSIQHLTRQCQRIQPLKRFMRDATDVIQRALSTTPAHIRPELPPFDCPLQLLDSVDNGSYSTPVVSTLLAVAQIGSFIEHLSLSNPCALDQSQSKPAFLAVCTGSLSAAATASCRNLTELLQIAPQVILLSFHVGLEASRRSHLLEESESSWASIVKDVDLEDLQKSINTFNHKLDDQCRKGAYISAIGESSVTVSGPPSTIQLFFDELSVLRKFRTYQLRIRSAFHAKHLTPVPHSRIFEHVDTRQFQRQIHHTLLSPSCGGSYKSSTLYDVLHEIVEEILQQPIDWRWITRTLSSELEPSATVVSVGPSLTASAISKWLPNSRDQNTAGFVTGAYSSSRREGSGGIAIVGMSIRTPGSETLEDFWDMLQQGKDMHQEIPNNRFDLKTHFDPTGKAKNATLTPYGVFIDRPGFFDPRFFNMSPREALQTDPQQRLMLLTTYEALENAGYSPNRTPSTDTRRIASFVGQTGDDYREFNANQDIDTYFITGNIRAFGPGRLSYHFGWEGPSYSIDTACSSSGASIQLACSSLLSRECDTAVSGGANLLTSPDLFAGLSRGGFLSKTGGCKTFDKGADGYVRAEGCGILILKRLEDALADHDNVLAVIRSAKTNHSAEAISITHPHEETQERLFKAVLNDSGVFPHQIDLAEMHGTGTQAGDTVESRSVTKVLCEGRSIDNPLILSTIKPNIGHGEAASGVSSVIKAVLMMQKNTVPPHIGIKTSINDKLPPFASLNARVCLEQSRFIPRANGDGKRRILVNNFDAAGGNTSIILEDSPKLSTTGQDPRTHKIVTFSAKSNGALTRNIHNVIGWLKTTLDARIEDLSYTTTSRRMHHSFRKAYTAASPEELISILEKQDLTTPATRAPPSTSAVFCFTGQGSQYAKMGLQLYETHGTFRDCIDEYAHICDSYGFPSFLPILMGDATALDCPIRTQLSIVAIELALALLWKSWGIQASAVIGHSIGEYSALCYAGVISVNDCLYLVGKRADLILRDCTPKTHAMLVVQASEDTVGSLLADLPGCALEIACINSPRSTVLSGPLQDIAEFQNVLEQKGFQTKILPIRYAFHSSQMDVVLDGLEVIARNVTYHAPKIAVASTALAKMVRSEGVFDSQYLRCQTRGPVRFQDAIKALSSTTLPDQDTTWIEVGPSSTCLNMIKTIHPGIKNVLPSLQQGRDDWQVLTSSLALAYNAGFDIDWNEFQRPFENSLQLLQLPNYSFDLKEYWLPNRSACSEQASPTLKSNLTAVEQQLLFCPTQSLHRIEKFESNAECVKVIFTADATEPELRKVLSGHLVNGEALCPSSVYADMAFAAASFFRLLEPTDRDALIQVDNMEVTKPLIMNPDIADQMIRLTATKQRFAGDIQLNYSSQSGRVYQNHATCVARLKNTENLGAESLDIKQEVLAHIERLRHASFQGEAHRILRSMVYKLFKNFVEYDPEYQGLEEVFLNSKSLEAAAKVNFQSVNKNFACNPYWIDSIAHLSGFILNGSEFAPEDSVFISHGWESLKIIQALSAGKPYQSYVRMRPSSRRTIFTGNVYLLDGNDIVAVCQGLKFQQVNRNILDQIIPSTGSTPLLNRSKARQSARLLPTSWKKGPSGTPAAMPAKLPPQDTWFVNSRMAETAPATRDGLTTVAKVRDVLVRELGLDANELHDDVPFTDLGVDSLLTMSLLSSLNAVVEEQLPASLFIQYPTVKDLCQRFQQLPQTGSATIPTSEHSSQLMAYAGEDLGIMTPATEYGDCEESCLAKRNIFTEIMRKIVAEEIGIRTTEIEDNTLISELGVDSLLQFSILTRIKEQTGMTLAATFFVENPTFRSIEQTLQNAPFLQAADADEPEESSCITLMPAKSLSMITRNLTRGVETPASLAVLMYSSSSSNKAPLFLIPDGSGSPSSYARLPWSKYNRTVYGLNSPFLADPQSFDMSLGELVALYVAEIRRIQPMGPYHVGGWSIGGVCAFEAASQLIRKHGQKVSSLILIDAPCPHILPPLPLEDVDFLQSVGVFDTLRTCPRISEDSPVVSAGKGLRDGTREHFTGSISALERYNAEMISSSQGPECVLILWARNGVWETLSSESQAFTVGESKSQHATTKWLMDPRSDFGTCGWEELLPTSNFTCHTVQGDHFSMMRETGVIEMGAKIRSFYASGPVPA